ncbi:hypothetical protein DXG01_009048 [Tephrocybe rancida]|nr:hypothetical protein DXG01_009048 [Tephrocybe rancida]
MDSPNICFEQQVHNKVEVVPRSRSPLKQDFAVKIIRPMKDELPRCQNKNAPPKLVPLFSSADSEDKDGDGYIECISDHEDDLLPTILQRKAMAEAKSAQEEYAPKNPLPLTTPTIEEIAPTTSQMMTSPSQTPSKDTAKKTPPPTPMIEETAPITSRVIALPSQPPDKDAAVARQTLQDDLRKGTETDEGNLTRDAAIARPSSLDRTEPLPVVF